MNDTRRGGRVTPSCDRRREYTDNNRLMSRIHNFFLLFYRDDITQIIKRFRVPTKARELSTRGIVAIILRFYDFFFFFFVTVVELFDFQIFNIQSFDSYGPARSVLQVAIVSHRFTHSTVSHATHLANARDRAQIAEQRRWKLLITYI